MINVPVSVLVDFPKDCQRPGDLAEGDRLALHSAALREIVVSPGTRVVIPTGLAIALPSGLEGQIRTDAELAAVAGLAVLNSPGTIDADYRGEIMVILHNHGTDEYHIDRGSRVAWLSIHAYARALFVESEDLPETVRGNDRFGSTGAS